MKPLVIGSRVLANGSISMGYDEKNERQVYPENFSEPIRVIICGQKRFMLGTYCKGGYSPYSDSWIGDYDPPSFTANGSVLVWEVREKIASKPFYVADDQIEYIVDLEFEHPSLV